VPRVGVVACPLRRRRRRRRRLAVSACASVARFCVLFLRFLGSELLHFFGSTFLFSGFFIFFWVIFPLSFSWGGCT